MSSIMMHSDSLSPQALHSLGHTVTSPGALLAQGGAIAVAATGDPHLTATYLVGVVGLALYHGSRALHAWVDGKRENRDLKRQIEERKEREAERARELSDLRAELRDARAFHASHIQNLFNIAMAGRLGDLAAAEAEAAEPPRVRDGENSSPVPIGS